MTRPFISKPVRLCVVAALVISFSALNLKAQTPSGGGVRELGISLLNKGEFEEAVKLLKQATKSKSDDSEAWYFLGIA